MPTLALSSTATGDLKQVQTWSKVATAQEAVAEVESQEAPEPEAAKPAARRGGSRTK